jgi:hypothetical protein
MIDLGKYPKFAADSKLMKRAAFLEVEWRRAYPDVDFQNQAGWGHAWLITSGKKYSDMARFLNNWFKRCQQDINMTKDMKGPIRMPTKAYQEPKPEGEVMTGDDFAKMKEAIKCKPTSI